MIPQLVMFARQNMAWAVPQLLGMNDSVDFDGSVEPACQPVSNDEQSWRRTHTCQSIRSCSLSCPQLALMTSPEHEGFAIAFIKDVTRVGFDLRDTATLAVTTAFLPAMYCTAMQAQVLRVRVPPGFPLLAGGVSNLDNFGELPHMPHADVLR